MQNLDINEKTNTGNGDCRNAFPHSR